MKGCKKKCIVKQEHWKEAKAERGMNILNMQYKLKMYEKVYV
jgi:hypothetical protein